MPHPPLLLVDDEPINLALMREVLSPHYKLVYANSGTAALEAARKHKPGLVLLDVEMPDMNGYAVCRQLRSEQVGADIGIIFVTGHSEPDEELAGFLEGADDYIAKPISPASLLARVRANLRLVRATRLERAHRDAITMLGKAGHYNDNDTGVHIWRMAAHARARARAAGWTETDARNLEWAAPMHDMGKIGIPAAILRKPGKLNAEEWTVMKTHCRLGHDILRESSEPLFQLAAEIALRHHERWDGSGYPNGLAGPTIPQSARIVAIADVFDALTTKRPYKDPWPVESAVQMLHAGAGSHFDPQLVKLFEAMLPAVLAIKRDWDEREASTDAAQA